MHFLPYSSKTRLYILEAETSSVINLTRLYSSSVLFLMIFSNMKSKEWYRNPFSSKNIPPVAKEICSEISIKFCTAENPRDTAETWISSELLQNFCQEAALPTFLTRGALHADLMSTDAERLRVVHTFEWCALHWHSVFSPKPPVQITKANLLENRLRPVLLLDFSLVQILQGAVRGELSLQHFPQCRADITFFCADRYPESILTNLVQKILNNRHQSQNVLLQA